MKKLIALMIAGGFALTVAVAQQGPTNEDQLILNAMKLEKRALVTQFLELPDDQAALFWPIYDKYEIDRKKITNRRYAVIQEYVSQYLGLTPEKTNDLVKESISISKADLALRDKYYKQVMKKVNPNVAARFFQIEEAIQIAVRAEIYSSLPFWPAK